MPAQTTLVTALIDGADADAAVPVTALTREALTSWLEAQDPATRRWVETAGFKAEAGAHLMLPDAEGGAARVLAGLGDGSDPWALAALPTALPRVDYRLDPAPEGDQAFWACFAWEMGAYSFTRYKSNTAAAGVGSDGEPSGPSRPARLAWPDTADREAVTRAVAGTTLVRDLINTPASDMGPEELEDAARVLADAHGATMDVIVGEDLERANYPAIYAVGKGSARPPRLIDIRWGREDAPRVTLVGKGVCFDSGGYDLKPSAGMKLMKKDMGGAANTLGLARMIMMAGLDVRLRLLIPAVENMVSGTAYRPQDVLRTRKGLTVEIGNTDAEGRVVLCDALAEADSEQPDLLVDCATLTGAARVALGPEIAVYFANDDALAADIECHAGAWRDPVWRLPLWAPYRKMLDSKTADINNAGEGGFAGAITAALYLKEFVSDSTRWAHFDIYGWNPAGRPGRPAGGEAFALRALYALVADRFG
ncbi:Peptidase B [Caenispirillum salinarum AK4]|uniref:Peptidase B n=1 Tax=Caenispirillum salinarum AK4 TaxID=1238182 RepID=K9GYK0_9PROT|nr:leucyl aminopeptidase family protein [Caenispirillum salinarum]EKV30357.1 Peptidase B [Caenispirillum salinarum AK4]